jgi:preprotein translocase subunit SecG
MWHTLILIVHILVCLELIVVVLLQAGKGGLGGSIFGGSSQTMFGTQSGNVLTKVTTASAVIFMITSILLTVVPKGSSIIKDANLSNSVQQAAPAPASAVTSEQLNKPKAVEKKEEIKKTDVEVSPKAQDIKQQTNDSVKPVENSEVKKPVTPAEQK